MTGGPHPALAAIHAGGDPPGRAMAVALAAGAWIAGLLEAPRPLFLEEDALASLLAPASPDDVLEGALARLAADGDPVGPEADEAGATLVGGGAAVGDAAAAEAEIRAHALAAGGPAFMSDRETAAAASQFPRAARNDLAAIAPWPAVASPTMPAASVPDRPARLAEPSAGAATAAGIAAPALATGEPAILSDRGTSAAASGPARAARDDPASVARRAAVAPLNSAQAIADRAAWVAEAARIAGASPIRIAERPPFSSPAPAAASDDDGEEMPDRPAVAPVPAVDPGPRRAQPASGGEKDARKTPRFGLARAEEKAAGFESVPIDRKGNKAGATKVRDAATVRDGQVVRDAAAAAEITAPALATGAPPIESGRGSCAAASEAAGTARNGPAAIALRAAAASLDRAEEPLPDRPAWVAEAVRLAAASPIRIAASPPLSGPAPAAASGDAGQETPSRRAVAPVPAPAVDPGPRRRRQALGGGADRRGTPLSGLAQAGERAAGFESVPTAEPARKTADAAPAAAGTHAVPMASGHPSSNRAAASAPATARTGARMGGFAGLAALGRGAWPPAAPDMPATDQLPPRPPEREAGSPPIGGPADARALLDELTEALRLEVLAAGIDPSRGRR